MKQICFFIIVSVCCIVTTFANATPLMTQGSTQTVLGYAIADRSYASDKWEVELGGYTSSDYTGVYLGTITNDKNDGFDDLLKLIRYYLNDPLYWITTVKVDHPGTTNDVLTVTYDDKEKSGAWSIDPLSDFVVDFYSIKGATEYALYYVNPALKHGVWTTRHLLTPNGKNIPEISHITVVKDPPFPVPEPATMLLFSTGVVGLAGLARRKNTP